MISVDDLYRLKEDEEFRHSYGKSFLYQFEDFAKGLILNHEHGTFKSQSFQDIFALFVETTCYDTHEPYFVEFGGLDGIESSNTFYLEKVANWNGLIAEPNPILYPALERNRNCNVTDQLIYNQSGLDIEFVITLDPNHSTVKEYINSDYNAPKRQNNRATINKISVTLNDLLMDFAAPERISYISVDTEGTEYVIMKKFFEENSRFIVDMFTIEHNFTDNRFLIKKLMTDYGYIHVLSEISRWDDFYIRKEIYNEIVTSF